MASVMDMLRMATGGMAGGGAPIGAAPQVPADGGMGPTIGPGAAPGQGQPMSLAPPMAGPQGTPQQGFKMGLPPSGILGLLRGQSPQGILGMLQQISKPPQPGQQGGGLMTAFQPQLNPGEPQVPGGSYSGGANA